MSIDESKVLVSGLLVKTRFSHCESWIFNIIESVDDNLIHIPLIESYFKDDILNADSLVIEFTDDKYQYQVKGKIVDIDIVKNQVLSVKINDFKIHDNNRNSERFCTNLGAHVSSIINPEGTTAVITNISSNSICFISKQIFNTGVYINLDVLTPSNKILTFKGEILRSKQYKLGYEHVVILDNTDIISENIEKLMNIIDERILKLRNITGKKTSDKFIHANVLLIENSHLIRTLVKNAIDSLGITNILEAADALEASRIIKQNKPDIVCLSYLIYEMEDKSIIQKLYKINPNIKIIILSGTPKHEIDTNLLEKYNNMEYISKTSNYDSFYNSLIKTIKNYYK